MSKCIHAYTEIDYRNYPGYISINEEPSGDISVVVRSPEHGGLKAGTIMLTRERLNDLAMDMLAYLADTQ